MLIFAIAVGGVLWHEVNRNTETLKVQLSADSKDSKKQAPILYGKQGYLIEKNDDKWIIDTYDAIGEKEQLRVYVGHAIEWLQTTILNQLPRKSDGTLDHDKAITISEISEDSFKVGDTVYAVARENIFGKKEFEAFRVYRIVYK